MIVYIFPKTDIFFIHRNEVPSGKNSILSFVLLEIKEIKEIKIPNDTSPIPLQNKQAWIPII